LCDSGAGGGVGGAWWIEFGDFCELFTSVSVCHLGGGPGSSGGWHVQRAHSEWHGESAGGGRILLSARRNPQWTLDVEEDCTLIVELTRHGGNEGGRDGGGGGILIAPLVVRGANPVRRVVLKEAQLVPWWLREGDSSSAGAAAAAGGSSSQGGVPDAACRAARFFAAASCAIALRLRAADGPFTLLPATLEAGQSARFTLTALTDRPLAGTGWLVPTPELEAGELAAAAEAVQSGAAATRDALVERFAAPAAETVALLLHMVGATKLFGPSPPQQLEGPAGLGTNAKRGESEGAAIVAAGRMALQHGRELLAEARQIASAAAQASSGEGGEVTVAKSYELDGGIRIEELASGVRVQRKQAQIIVMFPGAVKEVVQWGSVGSARIVSMADGWRMQENPDGKFILTPAAGDAHAHTEIQVS